MHRLSAKASAAALACAAAAGLAGSAGADAGPVVRGPASVVSGRVVVFQARGFNAGSTLGLVLSPADRGPCCAIRLVSTFLVSSAGRATLRFQMPLQYKSCIPSSPPRCHKVRWARGERAVLTVTGYLQQAEATTVVVR